MDDNKIVRDHEALKELEGATVKSVEENFDGITLELTDGSTFEVEAIDAYGIVYKHKE